MNYCMGISRFSGRKNSFSVQNTFKVVTERLLSVTERKLFVIKRLLNATKRILFITKSFLNITKRPPFMVLNLITSIEKGNHPIIKQQIKRSKLIYKSNNLNY